MAVDQAPEIKVRLTAEDTGVATAIRQLGQELKNLKTSEQEATEGALSLRKAFEGLAAIGGLLKLEAIGKEAFDSAVNIGKMADKTGISTETLSVFHKVAEDVAVSTESVDKALIKGAKSITEFEQGSQKAAKGFELVGIKQKDFAGLKTDEKIKLVAERLGSMQAGFQKAAAMQAIFSKGGAEMIPVLNALAAQGFDKAYAATEKLGLLLSQTTTDDFRAAKASMQELEDVAKGMATQFEAGFLPAVSDAGEALVDALTKGGVSFKDIGKTAGVVFKQIVEVFLILGQTLGTISASILEEFTFVWDRIADGATTAAHATALLFKGEFAAAGAAVKDGVKNTLAAVGDEMNRQNAIWETLGKSIKEDEANLFPSDEEEARRTKERVTHLRPDKETPERPLENVETPQAAVRADQEALRRQEQQDAIARRQAEALQRQLQDEFKIWQAYEKQREEVEKNSYEQGRLSTNEYYRRRQEDLKTETDKELGILQAQLKAAKDEAIRSAGERDAALQKRDEFAARSKAAGGDSTKSGQLYAAEAGRNDAAASRFDEQRIAAENRVQDLETKINTTRIEGETKSLGLENERIKATQQDQERVAKFYADLAQMQGKRIEQTRAEIAAQAEEERRALSNAGGLSPAQIDALVEEWKKAKLAAAEYQDAMDEATQKERQFQVDKNSYELDRAAIEARQKAGQISRQEAEKEINQLIRDRLPLLEKEAQAELAAAEAELKRAQATGNQDDIIRAQQQVQAARNLQIELQRLGTTTNQLGTQIKGAIQGDFQTFFNSLITNSRQAGKAFEQLGVSIVQSLERIVAQMLITMAIQKVMSLLGFGSSNQQANTQKQQQTVAANTGQAQSDVFVQAIEAVPFPGNLAAAPAASALVGAMMAPMAAEAAGGGLGSAAKGALLDHDMLIQAHAQEMILPADISRGMQRVIDGKQYGVPRVSAPAAIERGGGGNNYGGDTFHLHHTGPDALAVLEKHLVPKIQEAKRRGRLGSYE